MWIIAGEPKLNQKRNNEVLVRIFDSSIAHSDDSRTARHTRPVLAVGILGMMVDSEGNPIGLLLGRWGEHCCRREGHDNCLRAAGSLKES